DGRLVEARSRAVGVPGQVAYQPCVEATQCPPRTPLVVAVERTVDVRFDARETLVTEQRVQQRNVRLVHVVGRETRVAVTVLCEPQPVGGVFGVTFRDVDRGRGEREERVSCDLVVGQRGQRVAERGEAAPTDACA